MTKILPAVLSHTLDDLQSKLSVIQPLFTEAQIDLMDGVFVSNKTITAKDLRSIQTPLKLEAHLMVQDPTTWIQDLMAAHVRKIIVHEEIGMGLVSSVKMIKSLGLKVGVAVNPDSDFEPIVDIWDDLDSVQIMGVNPGHYGGVFQPAIASRIRSLRERGFQGEIEVDGGVTPETIGLLKRSGAQTLVVGHYFFGSEESPDLGNIGEKLNAMRAALGTP